MRIKPVILSGGSGTRLWPSSRKSLPKQFIDFPVIGSLFSRTLSRASRISDAARPLIISGKQHGFLCHQAAEDEGITAEFIFEETGRNTAPAIYFAALASRPEDVLLEALEACLPPPFLRLPRPAWPTLRWPDLTRLVPRTAPLRQSV